jgi:hypothetical protein
VLSWMLFHVIDRDSPLHGLTASDLTEGDALLVRSLEHLRQFHLRRCHLPKRADIVIAV